MPEAVLIWLDEKIPPYKLLIEPVILFIKDSIKFEFSLFIQTLHKHGSLIFDSGLGAALPIIDHFLLILNLNLGEIISLDHIVIIVDALNLDAVNPLQSLVGFPHDYIHPLKYLIVESLYEVSLSRMGEVVVVRVVGLLGVYLFSLCVCLWPH